MGPSPDLLATSRWTKIEFSSSRLYWANSKRNKWDPRYSKTWKSVNHTVRTASTISFNPILKISSFWTNHHLINELPFSFKPQFSQPTQKSGILQIFTRESAFEPTFFVYWYRRQTVLVLRAWLHALRNPGVNRNREISQFSVNPGGKKTFGLHVEISPGVISPSCDEWIFTLAPGLTYPQGFVILSPGGKALHANSLHFSSTITPGLRDSPPLGGGYLLAPGLSQRM